MQKLNETVRTVEALSTSHDERTMTGERKKRGKQCATSNRVNTDGSHLGDNLKTPRQRDDGSDGYRTHLRTWLCSCTSSWSLRRSGWIERNAFDLVDALD